MLSYSNKIIDACLPAVSMAMVLSLAHLATGQEEGQASRSNVVDELGNVRATSLDRNPDPNEQVPAWATPKRSTGFSSSVRMMEGLNSWGPLSSESSVGSISRAPTMAASSWVYPAAAGGGLRSPALSRLSGTGFLAISPFMRSGAMLSYNGASAILARRYPTGWRSPGRSDRIQEPFPIEWDAGPLPIDPLAQSEVPDSRPRESDQSAEGPTHSPGTAGERPETVSASEAFSAHLQRRVLDQHQESARSAFSDLSGGRYRAAQARLDFLVAFYRNDVALAQALIVAELGLERYRAAVPAMASLGALEAEHSLVPTETLATAIAQSGVLHERAESIRAWIGDKPNNPDDLALLIWTLSLEKDTSQAEAEIALMTALFPASPWPNRFARSKLDVQQRKAESKP